MDNEVSYAKCDMCGEYEDCIVCAAQDVHGEIEVVACESCSTLVMVDPLSPYGDYLKKVNNGILIQENSINVKV